MTQVIQHFCSQNAECRCAADVSRNQTIFLSTGKQTIAGDESNRWLEKSPGHLHIAFIKEGCKLLGVTRLGFPAVLHTAYGEN